MFGAGLEASIFLPALWQNAAALLFLYWLLSPMSDIPIRFAPIRYVRLAKRLCILSVLLFYLPTLVFLSDPQVASGLVPKNQFGRILQDYDPAKELRGFQSFSRWLSRRITEQICPAQIHADSNRTVMILALCSDRQVLAILRDQSTTPPPPDACLIRLVPMGEKPTPGRLTFEARTNDVIWARYQLIPANSLR